MYSISLQAKKDVAQIFNNILRRQIGTRSPTVEYVCTKNEILVMLVKGWVLEADNVLHYVAIYSYLVCDYLAPDINLFSP